MKIPSMLLLAAALAAPACAADAAKKSPAPAAPAGPAPQVYPITTAKVTAPLVLKEGAIGQPQQTELAEGGKAVLEFSVPKAGYYVIRAVVNAPGEDSNSFFLNVDEDPRDPVMIWDIDATAGFEERVVSWRGKGDADNDEFKPKKFHLTAGAHKLIIVGREPASLKSVSFHPTAE